MFNFGKYTRLVFETFFLYSWDHSKQEYRQHMRENGFQFR